MNVWGSFGCLRELLTVPQQSLGTFDGPCGGRHELQTILEGCHKIPTTTKYVIKIRCNTFALLWCNRTEVYEYMNKSYPLEQMTEQFGPHLFGQVQINGPINTLPYSYPITAIG